MIAIPKPPRRYYCYTYIYYTPLHILLYPI